MSPPYPQFSDIRIDLQTNPHLKKSFAPKDQRLLFNQLILFEMVENQIFCWRTVGIKLVFEVRVGMCKKGRNKRRGTVPCLQP